jgi:hypothetical protein
MAQGSHGATGKHGITLLLTLLLACDTPMPEPYTASITAWNSERIWKLE